MLPLGSRLGSIRAFSFMKAHLPGPATVFAMHAFGTTSKCGFFSYDTTRLCLLGPIDFKIPGGTSRGEKREAMDSGSGAGAGKAAAIHSETSRAKDTNSELPQSQAQAASHSQISVVDMAAPGSGSSEKGVKAGQAPDDTAQQDPGPGFAHIDGDIGGTYNDTKVDVIAVPCPGADPVQTWTSEYTHDGYMGFPSGSDIRPTVAKLAGDAILSPAIDRLLPRAGHIWVRGSIRKSASTARVMLYRHRALSEGLNLDHLARELLDNVLQQRQGAVGCSALLPDNYV